MPARGTTALYRPVPKDFEETYVRLGWSAICEHYGAGWKTVKKWIELTGRQQLREARRDHVQCYGAAKSPARADYVLRVANKRKRLSAVTVEQDAR